MSMITKSLVDGIRWGQKFESEVESLEPAKRLEANYKPWYLGGWYKNINSKAIPNSIC